MAVAPVSPTTVPALDPTAAARWRDQARTASPWLNEEIAARMADRLGWIRQQPRDWVDWAASWGGLDAHRQIAARYPQAKAWLAGEQAAAARTALSPPAPRGWGAWLQRWAAPPTAGLALVAPDAAELADLVWANMALHLHPEPAALLARWRGLLRVGGFAMFSSLGPDTLIELRAVHERMGWPAPMAPLTDMHDWGDMLVEIGFAEPVVDMERITLTYPSAERLLADLRAWGRNLHQQRCAHCRGPGYRQAWLEAVERELPRNAEGLLTVTVEVVYGHAFKPEPRVRLAASSEVSLQDMRALLRQPRPGH